MSRRGIAFALLLACGGDDRIVERELTIVVPTEEQDFEVEQDMESMRIRAFESSLVCVTEDPDLGVAVDPPPIAESTWEQPLEGGPAPRPRVPADRPVSVVVEGLDPGGALRFWGCDDDSDGSLEVVLSRPCVALPEDARPCPFIGDCPFGMFACDDDARGVHCAADCECTPGTILDEDGCECCSDEGRIEQCDPDGCDDVCPNLDQVCRSCPEGTALCVDGVATCFPPDEDEDGFTPCAGSPELRDCNDDDRSIRPGAEEVCNRVDDDCDDLTDEEVDAPCGAFGEAARCRLGHCTCGADVCTETDVLCCDSGCLGPRELDEFGRCPSRGG